MNLAFLTIQIEFILKVPRILLINALLLSIIRLRFLEVYLRVRINVPCLIIINICSHSVKPHEIGVGIFVDTLWIYGISTEHFYNIFVSFHWMRTNVYDNHTLNMYSNLTSDNILLSTELHLKNVYYLYSACSNPTNVV